MPKYEPFLIAPFQTGLDTDVEPWLAPADAFSEITNGHIRHGYLEKRAGYRKLAQLTHGMEITGATNADPAVFTVASTADLTTGDEVSMWYLAGGTWNSLNGAVYTVTVASGTTVTLTDSSGTAVDGTSLGTYTANSGRLAYYPGERVMGLPPYIASDGTRESLAGDTQRLSLFNSTSRLYQPLDLIDAALTTVYPDNDHMAGTDTDYLWWANWQNPGSTNRVYVTNGKAYTGGTPGTDGILYYDAVNRGTPSNPVVVQFQPQISSSGPTTLYGCKLMFSIKQRLICLFTYENDGSSTNTFPQRARWCASNDPSNWDQDTAGGGGFVDAPTGEHIISARQVQDFLVVHFTNSVWTLRKISDPALPFRWDRVNSFRACDGKMASVGYDRYATGMGIRGLTATDGVETRRIDERIEDFVVEEINTDNFDKVYGERSYANSRSWYLYPSIESDESDAALIYDDDSGAYTTYELDMNVLGNATTPTDYAAQDFTAANNLDISADDLDEETALSWYWGANDEQFLGGDINGIVYVMETGTTDNGTGITFSAMSSAWNPYRDQSLECQFGYIDFYVDTDQKTNFVVEFFKNDTDAPYATQAVDMLPNLNYRATASNIVPNADPTTGFVVTAAGHGLSEGDTFYLYGIQNAGFYNDREWTVGATVAEDSFSVDEDITGFGTAITGMTQANPAVVTAASHPFSNGQLIYIVDVTGMTEVNDLAFTVANVTTNTFELEGVDSTAYTAYSADGHVFAQYQGGGKIVERKFYRTKAWKRAYAGGTGYQHRISITNPSSSEPMKISAFKAYFSPVGRRILG